MDKQAFQLVSSQVLSCEDHIESQNCNDKISQVLWRLKILIVAHLVAIVSSDMENVLAGLHPLYAIKMVYVLLHEHCCQMVILLCILCCHTGSIGILETICFENSPIAVNWTGFQFSYNMHLMGAPWWIEWKWFCIYSCLSKAPWNLLKPLFEMKHIYPNYTWDTFSCVYRFLGDTNPLFIEQPTSNE